MMQPKKYHKEELTMKDMLGALIRKIVDLPVGMLGVIYDLVEKLLSETGQEWLAELKKFLRKKGSWTGIVVESILKLISGDEALIIDAVDGSEILADAKGLFAYIDSDLKNCGADEPGLATKEVPVAVYEMVKDATFSQMFGEKNSDVKSLCLTQHQIKNFVKKYRSWLRTDGYATFFLFWSKGNFFVARVYFGSDGRLGVDGGRFERGFVWSAGSRNRVVIPQLA